MHLKSLTLLALALGASQMLNPAALAQSASDNGNTDTVTQEILVVTGSRFPEQADDSLLAISVIDADTIRRSAAEDLTELLRLQPGVDVVQTGPAGSQTSVFLRGTNSNHTLVLVDGVRVNSTNSGGFAWENLPLNQIERVEILRGPRTAMYGSDAIGGVVQVFTRRQTTPSVRVTGGSHGSQEIAAAGGIELGNTRLSLSAGWREADGFSSQNEDGFAFDPDDDGFETRNLVFNGETRLAGGALNYSLLAVDNDVEFDEGVSDGQQRVASIGFDSALGRDWRYQLQAGYTRDELESDFGFFQSLFESERLDLGWYNQVDLSAGLQLLGGLEYFDESGLSGDYDESRDNTGAYLGLGGQRGAFDWEALARWDDNSEFGSELTGQLSLGLDLGEQWRATANVGQAFRAPNLTEQFSPGFGGLFAGNPDLQPETADNIELGLHWLPGQGQHLSLHAFHNDIDNLIAFSGADFQAVNIDRARIEGLELAWQYQGGDWRMDASATMQDADDSDGQPLLRRPDHKASFSADRLFDQGGWLGAELFWSGDRAGLGREMGAYTLLNLRAGWPLGQHVTLEARVNNLLDEGWEPAVGYNGDPRGWFLSVDWQP